MVGIRASLPTPGAPSVWSGARAKTRATLLVCLLQGVGCGRVVGKGAELDPTPVGDAGLLVADAASPPAALSAPDATSPADTGAAAKDGAATDAGTWSIGSGSCAPPCAPGDFCYVTVIHGGRLFSVDAASPLGCNPTPPACAPDPTCACLIAAVGSGPPCTGTDCATDDAGRITVVCREDLP
jgi:hypothetical protein